MELEGWRVLFNGICAGKNDSGRDLICERSGRTEIIQCKRWSASKEIHEDDINQLFGTTIAYAREKRIALKNGSTPHRRRQGFNYPRHLDDAFTHCAAIR